MSYVDFDSFIKFHELQLVSSGVPNYFWGTLYYKLKNLSFDAGDVFSLFKIDYDDEEVNEYDLLWKLAVQTEGGIKASNSKHIYLVDHAWTFKIQNARKQLQEKATLRERMANIVGLDINLEPEDLSEQIFNKLWKYCKCYSLANVGDVEENVAIWYMMDEVGSAVQHSEDPNFKIVPFVYFPEHIVYCLMFPIKDLNCGDAVTHNFVDIASNEQERQALSLPWLYTCFLDVDFKHEVPNPDYFLSGHIEETLPILSKLCAQPQNRNKFKVYAEYNVVQKFLNDSKFEFTSNEEEADILWYMRHFKNFELLSETSHKFVNQFPFEYVLTIKDLLCITCRRQSKSTGDSTLISYPPWLPTTYNLKTELVKFVSYFQNRAKEGLGNYWIIKPFNLARGLDTYITNNINFIVRLPVTGPKIVQKYIENPVLFYRPECNGKVKFDIRYVILLKSVKPLEAFIYNNFFLRFANYPFELKNFHQYPKHFTVMNYVDNAKSLKHMLCSEFKEEWEKQYCNISWEDVEKSVLQMFREMFVCAISEPPPCGISENPQSRAMYAADIMLEWTENGKVQPKLLEVNWTPDCKRACDYYPNFFNDIFNLLFANNFNSDVFTKL